MWGHDSKKDRKNGPDASDKQITYIDYLLNKLGHDNLEDVAEKYKLTKRQARGDLTVLEASDIIDKLKSDIN